MSRSLLVVAVCSLFFTGALHAKEGGRAGKPFGIDILYASGPFFMGNLNYNVANFLRLSGGYGSQSIGIGIPGASDVKVGIMAIGAALYVPGWNLSPFVGADYTSGSASLEFKGKTYEVTATGVAVKLGLDFQSSGGFNLGAKLYAGALEGTGVYAGIYF